MDKYSNTHWESKALIVSYRRSLFSQLRYQTVGEESE